MVSACAFSSIAVIDWDWGNDVGGRVNDEAAAFAIDSIEPDDVASLELFRRGDRRRAGAVRLRARRHRDDSAPRRG